MTLLEEALTQWDEVSGYKITLHSQERIEGILGGLSVIEAVVMREPFAVSLRWVANAQKVDRLLYMPDSNEGKLVVHPTGVLGRMLKSVRVDPTSQNVRKSSRGDVRRFGLANTIRMVLDDFRANQSKGTMRAESLGLVRYEDTDLQAIVLKRTTTSREFKTQTLLVWLEANELRPLQVQQFGWSDELLAQYSFSDYRPADVTSEDFTLASLGLE